MSGFSFGAATPQQQQPAPLFGTPLASSTPQQPFGAPRTTAPPAWGSTSFGAPTNNPPSTSAPTGFSFSSTPATGQQQQTGFSLLGSSGGGLGGGGGLGLGTSTTTSSALGLGSGGGAFSFGGATNTAGGIGGIGGSAPLLQSSTANQNQQSNIPTTSSFGGLGGIPNNSGPRISTLALGTDPGTGWSTRNDNRAVQELPVPPEILAAVEELKNQMKNHKTMMMEINRHYDLDIDAVSEQIEEVRIGLTTLENVMHKQELQCASLIKDMQELGKDMDLLSQARDVPSYGYGSTSNQLHNFLYELVDKYAGRMMKYKVEIERAEFALQTIVGAFGVNAKDLWDSLTSIKDTVILLAAQIQQLHEDMRNELIVHKNISTVLYATTPKAWLAGAISGNPTGNREAPPLERVLNTPSKAGGGGNMASLESVYHRTYSMLNRVPNLGDPRQMMVQTSAAAEALLRTPAAYDPRSNQSIGLSASMMGSYLGSSSPGANASLKRSKK